MAKFRASRRLRFEDTKRIISPEIRPKSFRTFEKQAPNHQLNLSQVVSGSTLWLRLYIANWSASCQLGFLTCSVHLLYSVDICTIGPHQPVAANYQPTYQINDLQLLVLLLNYNYYYYYCHNNNNNNYKYLMAH